MNGVIAAAAALIAIGALILTIADRRRLRRTMDAIDRMLDAAMDGSFSETRFDESLLSSLETKLAGYLSASEVSAKNLAAEKDKIKELLGDISHQTKTPVANILLYAQLLGEMELPAEARECVEPLIAQAEKLRFLIDALIKTSRLESGVLALHPAPASLGELMERAAEQARPSAEDKGVALIVKPCEAAALFDMKWTTEALYNLIDNAVKYTPSGGSVQVSAREYELFCAVTVADTGIGVAEEEQARIFARFYRSPAVAGEKGVGVGLFLCRRIVEEEGGYIRLRSALGKGSEFSLFLPRGGESLGGE